MKKIHENSFTKSVLYGILLYIHFFATDGNFFLPCTSVEAVHGCRKEKERESAMKILVLRPDDCVILKKPHPCGGHRFRIVRVGARVRLLCLECGRDLEMDRVRLEKAVRERIAAQDAASETKA